MRSFCGVQDYKSGLSPPPFGRFLAILNGIQKVEISYSDFIIWKLRTMGDNPRRFQDHQLKFEGVVLHVLTDSRTACAITSYNP